MHITRNIILALLVALIGYHANAALVSIQLDSHNLDKQHLGITIKTAKKGAFLHFAVSIQSKDAPHAPVLTAGLEVFDGTNQIVSCSVEKTKYEKNAVYEFDVSPKYLVKSVFTVGDMVELNGQPTPPAGVIYWFYLNDFADEK